MSHSNLPNLLIALAILAGGVTMLVQHKRIALYWSGFYGRPVPKGLRYVYLYVLGPVFLIVVGVLALLSVLTVR